MGLLARLLGRDRRARHDRALAATEAIRDALGDGRVDEALGRCRAALLESPDEEDLLRATSEVLLAAGERPSSELFARAADAPDRLPVVVEVGSHLLSREDPELAARFLDRALSFAPFDAVIRSELAIAQARMGRPAKAVETLALHPCLADDPGALFEFAWASLLSGDVEAARGSRDELSRHANAGALLAKLAHAIERAEVPPVVEPRDAREFLFLEHGAVLLECRGHHAGRHREVTLDVNRLATLLGRAAMVVRETIPRPRRVMAADDAAEPLADALAEAVDGERVRRESSHPDGRLPSGVVVARAAKDLAPLSDHLRNAGGEVVTFAVTLDWSSAAPHAPDLVGVLAREVRWGASSAHAVAADEVDRALERFVRDRRRLLPPAGHRVVSAYVPDAPLPWP